MMPATSSKAIICVVASLAAHQALGLWLIDPVSVEIEGGGEAATAALGSSFTDFVAGTARPVQPQQTDPLDADATNPVPIAETSDQVVSETSQRVLANVREPVANTAADAAQDPADVLRGKILEERGAVVVDETAVPLALLTPQTPAQPKARASLESGVVQQDQATTTAALKPLTPVKPQEALSPEQNQRAVEEHEGVQVSPRPSRRPESVVKRAAKTKPKVQETVKKDQPKPKAPSAEGNSNKNTRKGQATGAADAKAASTAATATQARAQGNAAASNYPGLVMRKIARVRRPKTSARGSAMVRFKIAAGGGLSSVSISRSSGSAQLDRAAMDVVRRAAPFPAPPSGARRSYLVEIKGR